MIEDGQKRKQMSYPQARRCRSGIRDRRPGDWRCGPVRRRCLWPTDRPACRVLAPRLQNHRLLRPEHLPRRGCETTANTRSDRRPPSPRRELDFSCSFSLQKPGAPRCTPIVRRAPRQFTSLREKQGRDNRRIGPLNQAVSPVRDKIIAAGAESPSRSRPLGIRYARRRNFFAGMPRRGAAPGHWHVDGYTCRYLHSACDLFARDARMPCAPSIPRSSPCCTCSPASPRANTAGGPIRGPKAPPANWLRTANRLADDLESRPRHRATG